MVSTLRCSYKMFADIKLYLSCSNVLDSLKNSVQSDIDIMVIVSQSWGLHLNVSKCVCIRFSPRSCSVPHEGLSSFKFNGEYISFVSSHSDLGITVDRSMKFHEHIRRVVNVCNGLTTNLFNSTLNRYADFLMNIYKSHVRPQLEYCSSVCYLGYQGD